MSDAEHQQLQKQGPRRSYGRVAGALAAAGALTLAACAVVSSPSQATPDSGAAVSASEHDDALLVLELRNDIETYLQQHHTDEHLSAVGLSVSLPGHRSTIDLTAGSMTFDGRRPVPADALWQIGSNTKAFTSTILLQLEAEHRLSMKDTLGKWLPQYPQWRRATITNLLNMTSRIQSYEEQPPMLNSLGADPHQTFTKPQLAGFVAATPPTVKPWSYSNTGYILGEMIIEKVTGHSYSDELYSRIINRLHLTDTFYRPDFYPRPVTVRQPAGYLDVHAGGNLEPYFDRDVNGFTSSWTRGAGGIVSSLRDLIKWDHALYSGQLLPAKQHAELFSLVSETTAKPVTVTSADDRQAFGLGVQQSTGGTIGTFWNYEGGTLGVRTLHVYEPRSGVIFAIGFNSYPEKNHSLEAAEAVHATLKAHGLTQ